MPSGVATAGQRPARVKFLRRQTCRSALDETGDAHGGGPHAHHHRYDHAHAHGGQAHSHGQADRPMGWRSLVAMGFAGGLVPSPSALVVLLGAIALHPAWFGLILVIAYGAGMAATLTGAGLVLAARGAANAHAPQPRARPG